MEIPVILRSLVILLGILFLVANELGEKNPNNYELLLKEFILILIKYIIFAIIILLIILFLKENPSLIERF